MKTLFMSLVISLGVVQIGLGGTEAKTLVHGRRTRSYRIHIPPSYREGHPMALVFALHGHGNTAAKYEKIVGFSSIADREGFIAVYPNAVPFGPKRKQLWNAGGIYGFWWAGQVDDVGFIAKLIDTVCAHYTIDPKVLSGLQVNKLSWIPRDPSPFGHLHACYYQQYPRNPVYHLRFPEVQIIIH